MNVPLSYGAFFADPLTSAAVEEGGGNATTTTAYTAAASDVTVEEGVRDREGEEQEIRGNVTTTATETSARRPGGNALADNKYTFSAGGVRDVLTQSDS